MSTSELSLVETLETENEAFRRRFLLVVSGFMMGITGLLSAIYLTLTPELSVLLVLLFATSTQATSFGLALARKLTVSGYILCISGTVATGLAAVFSPEDGVVSHSSLVDSGMYIGLNYLF